jgi:diguanylate cyclase (GGDEF)-like protein
MIENPSPIPKGNWFFWLAVFGLIAPLITFAIAMSGIAAETKIILLAAIASAYTAMFLYAFIFMRRNAAESGDVDYPGPIPDQNEMDLSAAIADPVTDLPNENALLLVLKYQLAETRRDPEDRPLTVASIDIKDFGDLNNKYGQDGGDRVLRFAADTIRTQLRSMDFLARLYADEFALVLPKADSAKAAQVLNRISDEFERTSCKLIDDVEIDIEINFGFASFGDDAETPEQLLQHAQLIKQRNKAQRSIDLSEGADEYVH